MSNSDDRAFDVYLARGSNLSQRYRDEATDKPSAAIDSLILTASRRAKVSMAEMPVEPWYKRWRVPIAFAAVLVLGVGVTLRTVMRENKLAEPPLVAPVAKPESTPAAPATQSSENKTPVDAAPPPASAVMGGALSTPKDISPDSEMAKKKSSAPEEIVIEKETPQTFPPSSAPIPPEQAIPGRAAPEPSPGAAPGKGIVESQAGRGSSGSVLDDVKPSPRQEQDTQTDKSVAEVEKRDADALARRRDQAPPKATEEAAPPAAPEPMPAETEAKAKPLEELGTGPRLPEGHAPVVDGKTFRSTSAELKREAEEKTKQRAAAAVIDDATEAPEAWLRRVAELRRSGRAEEAKAELERFRKRYPDYPAPVEK